VIREGRRRGSSPTVREGFRSMQRMLEPSLTVGLLPRSLGGNCGGFVLNLHVFPAKVRRNEN
jgi:hypothetical protein